MFPIGCISNKKKQGLDSRQTEQRVQRQSDLGECGILEKPKLLSMPGTQSEEGWEGDVRAKQQSLEGWQRPDHRPWGTVDHFNPGSGLVGFAS